MVIKACKHRRNGQAGMVLMVVLVLLVVITSSTLALMQAASYSVKMAKGNSDKATALQLALTLADRVIGDEKIVENSIFDLPFEHFPLQLTPANVNANVLKSSQIIISNRYAEPLPMKDCPRLFLLAGETLLHCHVFEIKVIKFYGKKMQHQITVNTGVIVNHIKRSANDGNAILEKRQYIRSYRYIEKGS